MLILRVELSLIAHKTMVLTDTLHELLWTMWASIPIPIELNALYYLAPLLKAILAPLLKAILAPPFLKVDYDDCRT